MRLEPQADSPTRWERVLLGTRMLFFFLPWESWERRGWRPLLAGLPALAALGLCLALGIVLLAAPPFYGPKFVADRAAAALAAGDYPSARIEFERTLQDDPGDKLASFGLAISLQHLGASQAAANLLSKLAPLDASAGDGYPPAQLLVAKELLGGNTPDAAVVRLAEAHLLRVLAVEPSQPTANALLAVIYSNTGEWEKCKRRLEHCHGLLDEKGVEIAQLCLRHGDEELADDWSRRAARYFDYRLHRDPQDGEAMIGWVNAQLMLKHFKDAADRLETAWESKRRELYRAELLSVYTRWAQAIDAIPGSSPLKTDIERRSFLLRDEPRIDR